MFDRVDHYLRFDYRRYRSSLTHSMMSAHPEIPYATRNPVPSNCPPDCPTRRALRARPRTVPFHDPSDAETVYSSALSLDHAPSERLSSGQEADRSMDRSPGLPNYVPAHEEGMLTLFVSPSVLLTSLCYYYFFSFLSLRYFLIYDHFIRDQALTDQGAQSGLLSKGSGIRRPRP